METLRRIAQQFGTFYQGMTGSQRATLLLVPLLVLSAFGYVIYNRSYNADEAVSWGRVFSTEEVIQAETAFLQAGLNTFRREGGRIFVPASEVDRYNAILVESDTIPTDWASEREAISKNVSIFSSPEQRSANDEIALGKSLSRALRQIDGIEYADVVWARSRERVRFPNTRPRVTATVKVKPRRGSDISLKLASSLRNAVAGMVPDLKADDVVVLNLETGESHVAADENDPLNNQLLARMQDFTRNYQQKIADHLSFIDDVIVSVNVDLDNLRMSVERNQKIDPENTVALTQSEETRNDTLTNTSKAAEPGFKANEPASLKTDSTSQQQSQQNTSNTNVVNAPSFIVSEKEFIGAMPTAVQVSISIPEDYYQAVAAKQGIPPGTTDEEKTTYTAALKTIRTEVEKNVQSIVSKSIPQNSPPDAVQVTTYTPVTHDVPAVEIPWTDQAGDLVRQWGGAVALGIFAIWALRMLQKSIPQLPDIPPSPLAAMNMAGDNDDRPAKAPPVELTERDRLQNVIRENPEMAASVISKWIRAAK